MDDDAFSGFDVLAGALDAVLDKVEDALELFGFEDEVAELEWLMVDDAEVAAVVFITH